MNSVEKINELTKAVADLRTEYHEKSQTMTRAEDNALSKKIKAAMLEVNDAISEGAEDCPSCKVPGTDEAFKAMGMICVPSYKDRRGYHPPVFEVGCPNCNKRSRGGSPEEAVARWNNEDYDIEEAVINNG